MIQTLNDLYLALRRKLKTAEIEGAELEAREIAAAAAGTDKRQNANWAHIFLATETVQRAQEMLERRMQGEPLAYLLGEWDFFGLTFVVTQDVLIPRGDTERLCELAVEKAKEVFSPRVLDLCCGTGCIGIALLKQVEDARVTAIDISEEALTITRENARRHEVTARHAAIQGSALEPPQERLGQFHLLVCNPPYITAQEMKTLDHSVAGYEPILALYGGEDGLDFYRAVANLWKEALVPAGEAFFECGWKQAVQVADILAQAGWDHIEICEDYAGVQRIVRARMLPAPAEQTIGIEQ